MSIALCIVALIVTAWLARNSLVWGIVSALTVGYFYGIVRANLMEPMAHFTFDAAVIGLYLGWLLRPHGFGRIEVAELRHWLVLLIGWPLLLTLLPIQNPMVQIVGLRGSAFLLPLILLGARQGDLNLRDLAIPLSMLNLLAIGFAIAEYLMGLEAFYPITEVTELIYASRVDDAAKWYRIPATFVNAHAYAGTMVCTLPLLVSRWVDFAEWRKKRVLVLAGMAAAIVGVFMSATRTHAVVLFVLVLVATLSLRMRPSRLAVWLVILGSASWVVLQDERLQRFTTLADTEYVAQRLEGSVNATFLTLMVDYPMGNGIGGGGTSLPYFLSKDIVNPVGIENEYGRILLELGLPGLILWVCFVGWAVSRGLRNQRRGLDLGRRLALTAVATYFLTAMAGIGMFTSVPQSAILMLLVGWIFTTEPAVAGVGDAESLPHGATNRRALAGYQGSYSRRVGA